MTSRSGDEVVVSHTVHKRQEAWRAAAWLTANGACPSEQRQRRSMRLGSWHSTEHWPWPGDEWSFGRIAAPRRQPTCASQAHVPRKPNAGGRTNCTFPVHVCNVVPLCLLHPTPTCLRARTPAHPRLQSSGTRRPRIFRHGPRLCSRRHRRIEATNRKQSTGQAVAAAGRRSAPPLSHRCPLAQPPRRHGVADGIHCRGSITTRVAVRASIDLRGCVALDLSTRSRYSNHQAGPLLFV